MRSLIVSYKNVIKRLCDRNAVKKAYVLCRLKSVYELDNTILHSDWLLQSSLACQV